MLEFAIILFWTGLLIGPIALIANYYDKKRL